MFTAEFNTERTSSKFLHTMMSLMADKAKFPVDITLKKLKAITDPLKTGSEVAVFRFGEVQITGFKPDKDGFLFQFKSTGGFGDSESAE